MNKRVLGAGVCAALVLSAACAKIPDSQNEEPTAMPENFIGVVNYADAKTVLAWQSNSEPFIVLDVRTEQEFNNEGRAPGAVLHSYYLESRRRNKNRDFLDQVAAAYEPDSRLLVMCSHGMRATQAAWELGTKKGFTNVYVFPGGYEGHYMDGYGSGDGWRAAGLPMVDSAADQVDD